MPSALSREFSAVAACCIWPPSDRRNLAIRTTLDDHIDWDRFLRIVKRQRVVGLVHDGLAKAGVTCPPSIWRKIEDLAVLVARQNLQFAAESLRIQSLFDETGVPLLFVKGVSLAQLAYGNLALKQSWDIDLLVTPDTVPRALQLLSQAGYHAFPALPPMADKRYQRWIRFAREFILFHKTNSVHVEIHWRLVDNRYFLSRISASSPTQIVQISQERGIRTLRNDDLFAYLCVHGAWHGWSQLKWLADVAALMAYDNESDAEQRLEAAKQVHAEDCVAQTFLLCDMLFGTPSVAALSRQFRRISRYRRLERVALKAMTDQGAMTEQGDTSFDSFPIQLSHFMLGRGWRFTAGELWNKLNGPYDQLHASLPSWLEPLYPLVRVAAWIKRRGRKRHLPTPPKPVRE